MTVRHAFKNAITLLKMLIADDVLECNHVYLIRFKKGLSILGDLSF